MKAMLIHVPNANDYDPEKSRELLIKLCKKHTPTKLAAEIGVSTRTLYGYMYGDRKVRYPMQYMLETLDKVM